MSFILDRLKKSGRQRALEMAMRKQTGKPQRETPESLLPQPSSVASDSAKKWLLAVAAVLLGTGVLYGVVSLRRGSLMPKPAALQAEEVARETPRLPAQPSTGGLMPIPHTSFPVKTVPDAIGHAEEQKELGPVKHVRHVTVPEGRSVASEQSDRSREENEKSLQNTKTEVSTGSEASGPVPEFKQLPQAVRKSLPDIRVTSLLYRKDSRLVSINGRIMSEGFNMDDGLFLEEITPEGVILSYGKYRFRVRAER